MSAFPALGRPHLLARACWDHDGASQDLRGYVVEHLGEDDDVLVVDETGDVKKGTATVGVQRQYTGTAGRIENSQVAVYLVYAGSRRHAFIDRELYLPRSWTDDAGRCAAAGVPAGTEFATKPALAQSTIGAALDAGVRCSWVAGDEVYGNAPNLRADLVARRVGYVLAVAKDHRITTSTGTPRAAAVAPSIPAPWRSPGVGHGTTITSSGCGGRARRHRTLRRVRRSAAGLRPRRATKARARRRCSTMRHDPSRCETCNPGDDAGSAGAEACGGPLLAGGARRGRAWLGTRSGLPLRRCGLRGGREVDRTLAVVLARCSDMSAKKGVRKIARYEPAARVAYRAHEDLFESCAAQPELHQWAVNAAALPAELLTGLRPSPEGVKKADALTTTGLCVISISGVYNWRSRHGTLGEWEDIALRGREVVICFDSDAATNRNVAAAMVRLRNFLRSRGARKVRYVVTPTVEELGGKTGVDDYLARGGTVEELLSLASAEPPQPDAKDDGLTDSRLAEEVAERVLMDRFRYVRGLGWLEYTRNVWSDCGQERVVEETRIYLKHLFEEAVKSGAGADRLRALLGLQSSSRIGAIAGLAKGMECLRAEVEDFDADPWLLNVANGVVDMRSRELFDHDPLYLMRHSTAVAYHPDAGHEDWRLALGALPDPESVSWVQQFLGTGATGQTSREDVATFWHGGGSNGKSTLLGAVQSALGSYARGLCRRCWC